jgi:hypothetical protein
VEFKLLLLHDILLLYLEQNERSQRIPLVSFGLQNTHPVLSVSLDKTRSVSLYVAFIETVAVSALPVAVYLAEPQGMMRAVYIMPAVALLNRQESPA